MLIETNKEQDTIATRILSRARDYGLANQKGPVFDRIFNRDETQRDIDISRNIVGQGKKELAYQNGMSPDGFSAFSPAVGINPSNLDSKRAQEVIAENQVHLFWKKNKERLLKYYRVAGRSEVSEALDQICDEAIYKDDLGEICSLKVAQDAEIGHAVKVNLHKAFRMDVLNNILDFDHEGWNLMRTLLIEGRLFLEVVYSEKMNEIVGVNLLPSMNMIIIIQDGITIGYRQMLEGVYSAASKTGGKNYIDFSPNQILYADLGLYGPGGLNDPRSILESAIKPFNQLNTIEDAITMYRIQWGSEKMVFKIDTGMMPKPKAEKHIKDQAKSLSRRVDYNSSTGEVTNYGRVIGTAEHFFIATSGQTSGSSIDRIKGGDNVGSIEDLKYFKRNLVNAMKVPPGRITALAGDKENFSGGKIGEVTQAEVAFARMVQRYQMSMESLIVRLFIMVLNTKFELTDSIKVTENFGVKFNKANAFQNYIDADVAKINMEVFDGLMKNVKTADQPGGVISVAYALRKGLKLNDADITEIAEQIKAEDIARDKEQ